MVRPSIVRQRVCSVLLVGDAYVISARSTVSLTPIAFNSTGIFPKVPALVVVHSHTNQRFRSTPRDNNTHAPYGSSKQAQSFLQGSFGLELYLSLLCLVSRFRKSVMHVSMRYRDACNRSIVVAHNIAQLEVAIAIFYSFNKQCRWYKW